MEIKNIYVSYDGKEFETEEECLEYERMGESEGAVKLFNADGHECLETDPVERYERADYIYVLDEEKADAYFNRIQEYSGYTVPYDAKVGHIYAYDVDDCDYYDLMERVEKLMALRDRIMEWVNNE